jgi:hypothetical protein
MTQRLLHHAQVSPFPHHAGSEGVPERMDVRSRDAGRPHELVDDALNASWREAGAMNSPGAKGGPRTTGPPSLALRRAGV